MLKINKKFSGTPAALFDSLSLSYDLRKRGRFKATTEAGHEVGVFIERGQVLGDGELLQTECGKLIRVIAQAETVVTASTDDWLKFSKVCYHLGNRHLPLQVGDRWLRFQPDHVLQELVELYGLTSVLEDAPFMPENGAYGAHSAGQGHGHSHSQDEDHHGDNPSAPRHSHRQHSHAH